MTIRSGLVLFFAAALSINAAPPPDPKAAAIAKEMMDAMGGQELWNRAHFVRYDFKVNAGGKTVVERSHLWDKYTGRYRIDDKTKEGGHRVTLFNAATQKGEVFVDGRKLDAAAAAPALKAAYATFINDMYWLSMPWKWMDQGVHLKYAGTKTRGKETYDIVELTFDHVGLTPGDKYVAYVSPKTHLMEHWEYTLQSGSKGSWDWEYVTTAGVKLAGNHKSDDGKTINMGDPKISNTVEEAAFTDPSRAMPN
jgi:hypothetical protein